ncbi:hypothetical protein M430DRAFT_162874 [Amorphotheca resinae ATCC 22711]|uniref:Uncharacterized protein n=1 Tax=Amorphotheca resinae ATCC 22711 TaxID=857342 RepID=A0A2T3BF97_AMORE|nr:hypothetical protein M430DRAFT_162874 [Amorphotheca resinae ATCC 22711]PSS28086.1 hypothetical protein M430DRAFT_162874 [Amorphotheca resinae ATCC 22711]
MQFICFNAVTNREMPGERECICWAVSTVQCISDCISTGVQDLFCFVASRIPLWTLLPGSLLPLSLIVYVPFPFYFCWVGLLDSNRGVGFGPGSMAEAYLCIYMYARLRHTMEYLSLFRPFLFQRNVPHGDQSLPVDLAANLSSFHRALQSDLLEMDRPVGPGLSFFSYRWKIAFFVSFFSSDSPWHARFHQMVDYRTWPGIPWKVNCLGTANLCLPCSFYRVDLGLFLCVKEFLGSKDHEP